MSRDDTTITRDRDQSACFENDLSLPRLVLAFECSNPLAPAVRFMLAGLDEVEIRRGAERSWKRGVGRLEIEVRDSEISRRHARLERRADGWELCDLQSKNGTFLNGAQVTRSMLVDGDVIETGGAVLVYRDEPHRTTTATDLDLATTSVASAAFRTVCLEVEELARALTKSAPTAIPVVIRGETGTGKELIARAIHDLSRRRGAFVPVNCGALPRTLLESELFGSKRGAFSGAHEDREGLVRRADGGTLFLDEIAELPEESQVALLRVLQEGEVRPVGSSESVRVDVRVVAATHQDLEARVAEGRFRKDLYARLIGYIATVPPLRSRREDIGTLIGTLLGRILGARTDITLHRRAARALMMYPYPLNVRELEQALRAAVTLGDRREIRIEDLPEAIRTFKQRDAEVRPDETALREQLTELLRLYHGNVSAVARKLGKAPIQIRRWCRRYGIEITSFRA